MRLSVVAVLVLVAVLAADTEAGWVRKTLRKVGNVTKVTIRTKAVTTVTNVVKRFGPALIGRVIGKRSIDLPLLGTISDKKAQEMVNALDLACTSFSRTKGNQALTAEDIQAAFGASDGNRDQNLSGEEFNLFENSIEAVQHCLELLKSRGM